MAKKLLIDATHPEEIRVAVVKGQTLEDFDSETSTKKQLKGNIYLAKVIRVEPSLQAAFVEFGGNRHGFLPFSEIHPDYYRLPIADRASSSEEVAEENLPLAKDDFLKDEEKKDQDKASLNLEQVKNENGFEEASIQNEEESNHEADEEKIEEKKSNGTQRTASYKYKIQEVIKRRHILLVQVAKEERGNKGASLTTYLSLPGRYCVLMPNAGHRAGGVSRKINDGDDRRRLKDLVKDLSTPDGMALIVRTAGQERNKTEIRRDYDYLLRLWNEIRELTLQSIAPCLVYAEGDLIKKAIRDIYDRDVEEVLVEGEEAYKQARNFMRQLIPSHARKVKLFKDDNSSLLQRFKVEEQIGQMMYPSVKLPSGGSIVINMTEALVAIDVNSGRSTRERHIDETALKTNLEAADEVARQMRLRDLAGIVVIDFIDMVENNHIQQVEKKLREAVKVDRARIQLGKISQFGLMELSRQRLRPSLLETYTITCAHCHGTGLVRSIESMALHVLRDIETAAIQQPIKEILVTVPNGVDLYLLNQKRQNLITIEKRFNLSVHVNRDVSLSSPDFKLDILALYEKVPNVSAEKVDHLNKSQGQIKKSSSVIEPLVNEQIKIGQKIVQESAKPEEDENKRNGDLPRNRRRSRKRRYPNSNNNNTQENTFTDAEPQKIETQEKVKEESELKSFSEQNTEQLSSEEKVLPLERKKRTHSRYPRRKYSPDRIKEKENKLEEPVIQNDKGEIANHNAPLDIATGEVLNETKNNTSTKKRGKNWFRRLLDS